MKRRPGKVPRWRARCKQRFIPRQRSETRTRTQAGYRSPVNVGEKITENGEKITKRRDVSSRADPALDGSPHRLAPVTRLPLVFDRGEEMRKLDAKDRDQQRSAGRPKIILDKATDVIQEKAPTGTSRAAALRRLRKYRPDIHKRVLAGEISASVTSRK